MPRSLRVLPPGGGFAGPLRVFSNFYSHWKEGDDQSALEWFGKRVGDFFPNRKAYFYSSGKKGLLALAEQISEKHKKPVVSLSSYSCPDLIACLAEKNFSFRFFDIDADSLEPRIEEQHLSSNLLLLSNLYGLADSFPKDLSEDTFVLDDSCQAALSSSGGKRIGARNNAFGLLSFGRGKSLPGLGGGALLVPEELASDYSQESSSGKPIVSDSLKSIVFWLLQSPWFYRIPSSLPFLGLGQTHYSNSVDTGKFSIGQVVVAASQLLHIESRASMHSENSAKWVEALGNLDLVQPMLRRREQSEVSNSPIRYPILVPQGSEMRNQLYKELTLAGLGVSCSYPGILPSYKQIEDRIISSAQEGASKVADRVLTLPVHRNVKDKDIELTVQIIKKALQR